MELPGPNVVVIGPRIALACEKRNAEGIYPPLSNSELSKKKKKKKIVKKRVQYHCAHFSPYRLSGSSSKGIHTPGRLAQSTRHHTSSQV